MGLKNLFRSDKSKNKVKKEKKTNTKPPIQSKKFILSSEEVAELILLEEEIDNDINNSGKFIRICDLLSVRI